MTDILQILQKAGLPVATKAGEVMNPGTAGNGKELVPAEVFSAMIKDVMPEYKGLLPLLPGNHGYSMPAKLREPVIGLSAGRMLFDGKTGWTTGRSSDKESATAQKSAGTQDVTIEQQSFIAEIDISDEQIRDNAANAEAYVKDRITKGVLATVDFLILNGDTTTGATGNMNIVDDTPTAGKYYLKADGARKLAYDGGYKVDLATLAIGDYASLLAKHGGYAANRNDILFVQDALTTLKTIQLDEIIKVANSGDKATVQAGLTPTPFGASILTHEGLSLADATGRISKTAGNNTKGQIVSLYKPAVQYGFGKNVNIEVVRVAGYGYRIVATFEFGFAFVDAGTGLAASTVALGYNATV